MESPAQQSGWKNSWPNQSHAEFFGAVELMKILLTVHQFFPNFTSGTEVLTYSVAQELILRGHEVRILTGYPGGRKLKDKDRFDQYNYKGIPVYRFHHAYTPMAGQTSMIEVGYDNCLAAGYFDQTIKIFKPDLVHFFHLNRLGTRLIESATKAEIPCFLTPTDFWVICSTAQLILSDGTLCHGPSSYAGNCVKHFAQNTQTGTIGRLAKWVPTAWADLLARLNRKGFLPPYTQRMEVTAISLRLEKNIARLNKLNKIVSPNSIMSELLVRHGVSPHLIVQSAYGVDETGSETNLPRSSPRKPFRLGFIGSLAHHKGCHLLIEALNDLPYGTAILKIYGKMEDFPEYSNKLKNLADKSSNIEFCGIFHNSKIMEVIADLDALVVPSLWFENTPLVIYSAQAACCPVVASDFPGISEIITHEKNGLLFEAGNATALKHQLIRLIDETGLLAKLSAKSRKPKSTSGYVDDLEKVWNIRR